MKFHMHFLLIVHLDDARDDYSTIPPSLPTHQSYSPSSILVASMDILIHTLCRQESCCFKPMFLSVSHSRSSLVHSIADLPHYSAWDYVNNKETRLPDTPNGVVRVYPASSAVAIFPLTPANNYTPVVLFCGGIILTDEQWGDYHFPNANVWEIAASKDCQRLTPSLRMVWPVGTSNTMTCCAADPWANSSPFPMGSFLSSTAEENAWRLILAMGLALQRWVWRIQDIPITIPLSSQMRQ